MTHYPFYANNPIHEIWSLFYFFASLKLRQTFTLPNSILSELTLMLAWSAEEAGRILETYKTHEDKPPDLIMEKNNPDPHSKLVEALTSVKSVNKTDAATLIAAFGTMEGIVAASIEDLSMCPGTVSSVEIAGF